MIDVANSRLGSYANELTRLLATPRVELHEDLRYAFNFGFSFIGILEKKTSFKGLPLEEKMN